MPDALALEVAGCAETGAGVESLGHLATLSPRMVGTVVGRGSWSGLRPQHECDTHRVSVGSPRRSQMTRRCYQFVVYPAEGDTS